MSSLIITHDTEKSFQCIRITEKVKQFANQYLLSNGAICISSQHTTTAVIINEMEERLLDDLQEWLDELVEAKHPWRHNDLHLRTGIPADEPRNAHAHLQALLLGHQVIVNVKQGQLQLGTYQDIILVELDGPRQRTLSLQWLSD